MIKKIELSVFISDYLTPVFKKNSFIMGEVQAVFGKGFNVKVNNKLIFMSVTKGYLSPIEFSFGSVDLFDKFIKYIRPGDKIRISHDKLVMYSLKTTLIIRLTHINWITTQLPKKIDRGHLDLLINELNQLSIFERSGFNQMSQKSFSASDLTNSPINKQKISNLIGYGVGLTPSGDDYLLGQLLAESVFLGKHEIKKILKIELNKHQTTEVSKAYYKALFQGYGHRLWLKLLEGLESNDQSTIEWVVEAITHYGATSGYDFLLGLQVGLKNIKLTE